MSIWIIGWRTISKFHLTIRNSLCFILTVNKLRDNLFELNIIYTHSIEYVCVCARFDLVLKLFKYRGLSIALSTAPHKVQWFVCHKSYHLSILRYQNYHLLCRSICNCVNASANTNTNTGILVCMEVDGMHRLLMKKTNFLTCSVNAKIYY